MSQYGNIAELGVFTLERVNNGAPLPILTVDGTALSGSTFTGANGVDVTDPGEGISITCGNGNTSGNGGAASFSAGDAGTTGAGGNAIFSAGAGGATSGGGGLAALAAGDATTSGVGGGLNLSAGVGAGAFPGGGASLDGGDGGLTGDAGGVTISGGQGGGTSGAGGNIILQPGGVTSGALGAVLIDPVGTNAGETGELRFLELQASGTDYTGWKAPDAMTAAGSVVYTMPDADAVSSGFVLASDSAGTLSWIDPSSAGHSFQAAYDGGAAFTSAASSVGSATGAILMTATLNTSAAFQITTALNVAGGEVAIELHGAAAGVGLTTPLIDFYEGGTFSGTGLRVGGIGPGDDGGAPGTMVEGAAEDGAVYFAGVRGGTSGVGGAPAGNALVIGGTNTNGVNGVGGDALIEGGAAETSGAVRISTPAATAVGIITINTAQPSGTGGAGGAQVNISTGAGGNVVLGTAGSGGEMTVAAGDAGTGGDENGQGGNVNIDGGAAGSAGGIGGAILLTPGNSSAVALDGGVAILNGGSRAKVLILQADNADITGFVGGATGPGGSVIYVLPVDAPTSGQHLSAGTTAAGRNQLTWEDGGTGGSALGTFGNADLTGTTFVFVHGLSSQYVGIELYDNNNNVLYPDDVTATSASTSTLELATIIAANGGTLPGGAASWNVRATS